MLQKINYRPIIENGVLTGVKRNSIVLSDESMTGFDSAVQLQEYIKVRKIPILVYRDIEGDPGAAAQQYSDYYANLEAVAVPFEAGLVLKTNHPYPISHNGKLYEVIQGHTTQSDWTPDIVPALFKEIPKPAGDGYPEWVQPTGAHDAYQIGDRATYGGKDWECIAGDAGGYNSWSPDVYGWKEI